MTPPHIGWPQLPVQRVSRSELRRLFNQHQFYHRLRAGSLQSVILRSYLAPASAGQLPGAEAQIVVYKDGQHAVAAVHQYVNPDGSLGASGMPDPIGVVIRGTVYIQERTRS
jgi:hypothetical protein